MGSHTTVRCLALVIILCSASFGALAQSAGDSSSGRRVNFELTQFRDTLFTAVDGALRVRFDDNGQVWYTTEGGLVHVDHLNATREIFTEFEGLPSSYALGLDISGRDVYVGTDLGLGIIDRATGDVTAITRRNSPLPDDIVQDVLVLGDDVWLGTRFAGVAIWDSTRPFSDDAAWTFKNTSTTADYAKGVRRITATPGTVYVATDGDGLWSYQRSTGQWSVTVKADGLPANEITSAAERNGALWVGTIRGLAVREPGAAWRVYNGSTSGIPDERVYDVDVLPTVNGTMDVFAATRRGVWQLEPETGRNGTRAQSFGILGGFVLDNEFETGKGWAFASTRGVSLLQEGEWSYFATGPTDGPTWGPVAFGFTSASVGDGRGFLWFGASHGLSAYRLPSNGVPGYWQNFGAWQNYPGSVVNWIDTEGNVTWFATNQGVYGFEHETGRWIPKLATDSRNLAYGVEAVDRELWIPLFGDGLRMEDLDTGIVRRWSTTTTLNPIADDYLTDVRVAGNDVWIGSAVGLIRMDRATGTVRSTHTTADGVPGNGVIFRAEPDGALVWLGTANGGVARFDVASGKVTRVWNASNADFPEGQVRALHREGGRLWVGTNDGLVRIDISTGTVTRWNQTGSDLVQNFVNGIASAQGLLYLATLSGVQRFDIATETFLPLRDGPGVIRVDPDAVAEAGATSVSVRIDSPRDGIAVTGPTEIRGTALAFGSTVDRVEVRIGAGEFAAANGTESWSYDWDASSLPPNEPVAITVRAFAGELTGQREIAVTPVAAPTVPLMVDDVPPADAFANRPFKLAARAQGDDPLTVSAFYRAPGSSSYTRLPMARAGDLFTATIPARDMREGELRYYIEAQSGLLLATAAGEPSSPTVVTVQPAPRLAVAVDAPALVEATAGEELRFALNVTNAGTEPATFRVEASGLRAAWVSVPPDDLDLEPGETRAVNVRLLVPDAAFADNTTLTFVASDASSQAEPASTSVPLRILGAPGEPAPPTRDAPEGGSFVPLPAALPLFALALALALARRRRSS